MKFCIKFLLATFIIIAGSFLQSTAHSPSGLNSKLASENNKQSVSYSAQEDFTSFNISSIPSEQKKDKPGKDLVEIEEAEEENEIKTSKKHFNELHYFTSAYYAQLLKQFLVYSDNKLAFLKLCFYNAPESSYLLFQVFRI